MKFLFLFMKLVFSSSFCFVVETLKHRNTVIFVAQANQFILKIIDDKWIQFENKWEITKIVGIFESLWFFARNKLFAKMIGNSNLLHKVVSIAW